MFETPSNNINQKQQQQQQQQQQQNWEQVYDVIGNMPVKRF